MHNYNKDHKNMLEISDGIQLEISSKTDKIQK